MTAASIHHVMHCQPCQIAIWSEVVNTALRRARVSPIDPPVRSVREVTGAR